MQSTATNAIVSIFCKGIRRFGKRFHYHIQPWMSGGYNFMLQDLILAFCNLESPLTSLAIYVWTVCRS